MTGRSGLAARRRLDQSHQLWHRALASYPEVDAFCLEVNSLIPALRSVTWLLQKDLKHRDGFEAWYVERQDAMRADPVLRWLVDARNRIEKQGDLELRSTARVSVIASWLPAPYDDFDMPPLLPPAAIAFILAARGIPDEIRDEGILKVERRWVSGGLPDLELLDGCATRMRCWTRSFGRPRRDSVRPSGLGPKHHRHHGCPAWWPVPRPGLPPCTSAAARS